jgi:hypothetical protein
MAGQGEGNDILFSKSLIRMPAHATDYVCAANHPLHTMDAGKLDDCTQTSMSCHSDMHSVSLGVAPMSMCHQTFVVNACSPFSVLVLFCAALLVLTLCSLCTAIAMCHCIAALHGYSRYELSVI